MISRFFEFCVETMQFFFGLLLATFGLVGFLYSIVTGHYFFAAGFLFFFLLGSFIAYEA